VIHKYFDFAEQIHLRRMTTLRMKRICKDLSRAKELEAEGIYLRYKESDLTTIHAIIIGPSGTPYEGGVFRFLINIPETYPLNYPSVKFLTTDNGQVRFNPNLYNCGKVCLSILGTWKGPSWTACMNLSSLMISIQSLLCEEPFYNEPGYKKGSYKAQSNQYNETVRQDTFRVAIYNELKTLTSLVDNPSLPRALGYEDQSIRFVIKAVQQKQEFILSSKKSDSITSDLQKLLKDIGAHLDRPIEID